MTDKDVMEVKDFFAWLTEMINSFISMLTSLFGGLGQTDDEAAE